MITDKVYFNFKSYNHYKNISKNKTISQPEKRNLKPIIGSALGVAGALAVASTIPKKDSTMDEVLTHALYCV